MHLDLFLDVENSRLHGNFSLSGRSKGLCMEGSPFLGRPASSARPPFTRGMRRIALIIAGMTTVATLATTTRTRLRSHAFGRFLHLIGRSCQGGALVLAFAAAFAYIWPSKPIHHAAFRACARSPVRVIFPFLTALGTGAKINDDALVIRA
jgi:hypothetical protein